MLRLLDVLPAWHVSALHDVPSTSQVHTYRLGLVNGGLILVLFRLGLLKVLDGILKILKSLVKGLLGILGLLDLFLVVEALVAADNRPLVLLCISAPSGRRGQRQGSTLSGLCTPH